MEINKDLREVINKGSKYNIGCYLDLVNILKEFDWLPSREEIIYLGRFDDWVKNIINKTQIDEVIERSTIIFVLREWVRDKQCKREIVECLKSNSIIIVAERILNRDETIKYSNMTRGGNWGHGDREEVNGGGPYAILVCKLEKNFVKNLTDEEIQEKVFTLKRNIRKKLNRNYIYYEHANMIHATDDAQIAVEYLRLLPKEVVKEIKNCLEED